ncbi:hypothetical protein WHI96_25320 [Pseudonocardia tropica]|uniref:Transposase n=1 Tax=Pseudonocardia tropica TaxID=681289 RepID=A0ABV1K1N6_9PSEU
MFLWADQLRVRSSWLYEWWSDAETIGLTLTDKNTVDKTTDDNSGGAPAGRDGSGLGGVRDEWRLESR